MLITALTPCIALHLNNEVIESFGVLNEKFEEAKATSIDDSFQLKNRALQHKSKTIQNQAKAIENASNKLYIFLENTKEQMLAEVNMTKDSVNFAIMDKPSQFLFKNDREVGIEFVFQINTFRKEMIELTKDFLDENLSKKIQNLFETNDRGTVDWLTYEFDDFPLIASFTKLTALQNEIRQVEILAYKNIVKEK